MAVIPADKAAMDQSLPDRLAMRDWLQTLALVSLEVERVV